MASVNELRAIGRNLKQIDLAHTIKGISPSEIRTYRKHEMVFKREVKVPSKKVPSRYRVGYKWFLTKKGKMMMNAGMYVREEDLKLFRRRKK